MQRAYLETAIELLPDEGHRHILRCLLARLAAGAGELDAAEEWLSPCHPEPVDLRMDTAYRLARATLAVTRGDHRVVLALLGRDTPLAEDYALDCALLRIHALDAEGRSDEAVAELEALEERVGEDALTRARQSAIPRGLCARVRLDALRRPKERWIAEAEASLETPNYLSRSCLRRFGRVLRAFAISSLVSSAVALGIVFLIALAAPGLSNADLVTLLWVGVVAGPVLATVLFVVANIQALRRRSRTREQLVQARRELAALASSEAAEDR
ncbi:MAG TPA: hypothetical protein RMH99_07595 [Sandaracinaceae bacterium LLY-WYZ-13_1]|nr:hypothetical protein [Sandaracinaceae bacterium LLY-WYZ-13_1]